MSGATPVRARPSTGYLNLARFLRRAHSSGLTPGSDLAAPRQQLAIGIIEEGLPGSGNHTRPRVGYPDPSRGRHLGAGKRIYVWFEAVIGYLSAAKEWAQLQGQSGGMAGLVARPRCRELLLRRQGQHPFSRRDLARRAHRVWGAQPADECPGQPIRHLQRIQGAASRWGWDAPSAGMPIASNPTPFGLPSLRSCPNKTTPT